MTHPGRVVGAAVVAAALAMGVRADVAAAAGGSAWQSEEAIEVASAVASERWFATADGIVRVRHDDMRFEPSHASAVSATQAATSPAGARVRILQSPGDATPQRYDANAAPRIGAVAVPGGAVRRIEGLPDVAETTSTRNAAIAGVRIVDLPPGAHGPIGVPEPMTLYRVTPAPR